MFELELGVHSTLDVSHAYIVEVVNRSGIENFLSSARQLIIDRIAHEISWIRSHRIQANLVAPINQFSGVAIASVSTGFEGRPTKTARGADNSPEGLN